MLGGGANKLKVQAIWSNLLDPNALWTGIFVKIKPNVLSSGDIALASTLISTCLSTDELLLSGTRVVENGPITWGQTYKTNIDSLEQQKWEEPAPQGQFETSQLELSLKSHAFEKFVYLHTHSLVQRHAHKYERNIVYIFWFSINYNITNSRILWLHDFILLIFAIYF